MEEKKRCPGCGAVFQTADENLPGFLAPGKEPKEGVLCKRCFQMKHYGVFRKALISDPNIQKELRRQADSCAALFLVLDVTRPEISMSDLDWAEELNKPVFLVANKVDLLEPWTARKEVLAWLSEQCGVPAEQIFLISAHSRRDMTDLRARLRDTFSPEDRILFAGAANVGKSTILGALLKNDLPTVSRLPGTTVGMTEYRMEHGPVLVDAPGLKGEDPFVPVLCPDCLTALSPRKSFQSSIEVFKPGQTIFFGGLAQLTVTDAGERGWVRLGLFAPDSVTLHKTREERIESLIDEHSGELLTPPCEKCAARLASLNWKEESFRLHAEEDLVIPGIGWAALYSGACAVTLRTPEFVAGAIRPWLIPSPARRQPGKKRY
ncbi:MAG: 50S ribosome-binding GTPase [Pyramidobacter sp.]|nr:50S ribosome-binding GTPase [Pyramidobacter sp.]